MERFSEGIMSDTTDDMEAGAGLYEAWLENQERKKEEKIWTMRDGTEILIKDMETSHIINSINMINRNCEYGIKWILKEFNSELMRRNHDTRST